MPIITKYRILAAKAETVVGTAETVAAADAKFDAYDVEFDFDVDAERLPGQAALSQLPSTPGLRGGMVKFKHPLFGGASMPQYLATFMPACGWKNTAGVWTPSSIPIGGASTDQTTLTIVIFQHGKISTFVGCQGTVTFNFPAGKRAFAEFEFKGVAVAEGLQTIIAPDYPRGTGLRMASSALALGAFTPVISNLTLKQNNQVVLREDSTKAAGYVSACIVDRDLSGELDPESQLVATWDAFSIFLAGTEVAATWTLGSSGNRLAFSVPKFQHRKVGLGNRNGIQTTPLTYQANRSADAGDDEVSITVD